MRRKKERKKERKRGKKRKEKKRKGPLRYVSSFAGGERLPMDEWMDKLGGLLLLFKHNIILYL